MKMIRNKKLDLKKVKISNLNAGFDEIWGGRTAGTCRANTCVGKACSITCNYEECTFPGVPSEGPDCMTQTVCAGWNCPSLIC